MRGQGHAGRFSGIKEARRFWGNGIRWERKEKIAYLLGRIRRARSANAWDMKKSALPSLLNEVWGKRR